MQLHYDLNQVYSSSPWVHNSTVYKKECNRKLWAEGSRNWDTLSVCRWWILALHVLLLPKSGCEIYGPYKGCSSCGWQTLYSPGQEIMTPAAMWNCDWDLSESPCRKSVCMWVGMQTLKLLVLAWNCVFIFLFSNPLTSITLLLSWVINIESYRSYCPDPSFHAQIYSSAISAATSFN